MAAAKLWSSVGSAGAINPPDVEKVVLVGSLVQLGVVGGVIGSSREKAASRSVGPQTQAVVRYGVTAVDGVFTPDPGLSVGLGICCRKGGGQIAAQLVQVSIPGGTARVSSVVETPLVEFQSESTNPNAFAWEQSFGGFDGILDFTMNAYYVEVVLTVSGDVVVEYPPAVSTIQVIYGTG